MHHLTKYSLNTFFVNLSSIKTNDVINKFRSIIVIVLLQMRITGNDILANSFNEDNGKV